MKTVKNVSLRIDAPRVKQLRPIWISLPALVTDSVQVVHGPISLSVPPALIPALNVQEVLPPALIVKLAWRSLNRTLAISLLARRVSTLMVAHVKV